jgi:hypothetical protein
VLLALSQVSAQANAGTPLMWGMMLHLVFGNALIGLAEGLLLARAFGLKRRRCIWLMIAANYFSAWVGRVIIQSQSERELTLYEAMPWIWSMIAAAFLLTILLEWPFVALCFRREARPRVTVIGASALVQALSYVALLGCYSMVSRVSFYTKSHLVAPADMTQETDASIYYISAASGDVYSLRPDNLTPRFEFDLNSSNRHDRLAAQTNGPHEWTMVFHKTTAGTEGKVEAIASGLSGETLESWEGWDFYRPSHQNFGKVPSFNTNSNWGFYVGYWPVEGILAINDQTTEIIRLAAETPMHSAWIRNATQLSNNQLVFQLGDDQICLLDPTTRQIALLARGRGPVVAINVKSQIPETPTLPALP